jgi:hypothetical protein
MDRLGASNGSEVQNLFRDGLYSKSKGRLVILEGFIRANG